MHKDFIRLFCDFQKFYFLLTAPRILQESLEKWTHEVFHLFPTFTTLSTLHRLWIIVYEMFLYI